MLSNLRSRQQWNSIILVYSWLQSIGSIEVEYNADRGPQAVNGNKYIAHGWYDYRIYSPITYAVISTAPQLPQKKTCDAIRRALNVWQQSANITFREMHVGQSVLCDPRTQVNNKLKFIGTTVNGDRHDPQLRISFRRKRHGDKMPFDGRGNNLAHAWFPGSTPRSGDVHFDIEEPWTLDAKQWEGTDLFLVALHEIGHALGLEHNTDYSESIMYDQYKSESTKSYKLSEIDRYNMVSLYGPYQGKVPELPIHPPPKRPSAPRERDPTREYLCRMHKYDAAGFFGNEFWIFDKQSLYRVQKTPNGRIITERIADAFPGLRQPIQDFFVSHVPAKLKSRRTVIRKYIYIFTDKKLYKYALRRPISKTKSGRNSDGSKVRARSLKEWPKRIKDLGRRTPKTIIGSTFWQRNNKAYIFDNHGQYYRFDIRKDRFQSSFKKNGIKYPYPSKMSMQWHNVPHDFDTVFNTVDNPLVQEAMQPHISKAKMLVKQSNGTSVSRALYKGGVEHYTVFVKGAYYYVHQNYKMKVASPDVLRHFRQDFLKCQNGPSYDKGVEPGVLSPKEKSEQGKICVKYAKVRNLRLDSGVDDDDFADILSELYVDEFQEDDFDTSQSYGDSSYIDKESHNRLMVTVGLICTFSGMLLAAAITFIRQPVTGYFREKCRGHFGVESKVVYISGRHDRHVTVLTDISGRHELHETLLADKDHCEIIRSTPPRRNAVFHRTSLSSGSRTPPDDDT